MIKNACLLDVIFCHVQNTRLKCLQENFSFVDFEKKKDEDDSEGQ